MRVKKRRAVIEKFSFFFHKSQMHLHNSILFSSPPYPFPFVLSHFALITALPLHSAGHLRATDRSDATSSSQERKKRRKTRKKKGK